MNKEKDILSIFTPDEALEAYYQMIRIRKFEEKIGQIYGMGQIAGFCHLCIGQEAISIGMHSNFKEGDAMITGYRDHGHNMIVGTDPKYILAELMGRENGISKGKGGSMHLFDIEKGFFGGHGIVGAQVSLGTGIAFAKKYNNTDNICMTFFGDGAANQGQVYESFNMAKLWNLPVLYIIENNKYAMGTSIERHSSSKDFHNRGAGFNIPGYKINGMDVCEVKSEIAKIVKDIRSGSGPVLVELETYRYRGHSMSDPGKYRTKDEIDEYRFKNDPIGIFEKKLKDKNIINDDKIAEFEKLIKDEINMAYEFCLNSPEPAESELLTEIYTA